LLLAKGPRLVNHDEIMVRGKEMLNLNEMITKYTETYVRPSLSDIMAFDIIKDMINESIEDPENSDYLFKSDIYRIWADVLESDTVWSLEYGTDTMFESVAEWLQESGNMVYKEDIEEEEDEDESDE